MNNSLTESIVNLGLSVGTASLLASIIAALIIALICYIMIKVLNRVAVKVFQKMHLEAGVQSFLSSAINIALWFVAVLIIAPIFGIEVTSLIAVLSVAGLALSLSVQSIMSNVFSGVTVLTTRPFVVGNFVELNGVMGTVNTIGIFYTTIKTPDNKLIYIPNSEVTSAKIINYSHEEIRRVDLNFCVSYKDKTEDVKASLIETAKADARVLSDPAPFAAILSYKDSTIEYVLRTWVKGSDYWDVYFALNESVRDGFEKNGIELSYSHLNVHIEK